MSARDDRQRRIRAARYRELASQANAALRCLGSTFEADDDDLAATIADVRRGLVDVAQRASVRGWMAREAQTRYTDAESPSSGGEGAT